MKRPSFLSDSVPSAIWMVLVHSSPASNAKKQIATGQEIDLVLAALFHLWQVPADHQAKRHLLQLLIHNSKDTN